LKAVRDALRFGKSLSWSPLEDSRIAPEPEEAALPSEGIRSAARAVLPWVAAFIAVAACVYAIMYFLVFANPQEVAVPDIIGKTLPDAQAVLAEKGLKIKTIEEYDNKVPAGQIIRISPAPGRMIKAGKEVLVFVSKGAQFAVVPDVVGLTEAEGIRQIRKVGLVVGNVTREFSDTVAPGDVASQSPKAGTKVARLESVSLVVSLGPKPPPAPPPIDINPPETTNTPAEEPVTGAENAPKEEANTTPDIEASGLRRRTFNVQVSVPKDGKTHRVEIRISDEKSERTVYDREHVSGESFKSPPLEGFGEEGTIQVFVDGQFVKERKFNELDKTGGNPSGSRSR